MYYVEIETPGTVLVADELLANFTTILVDETYTPLIENYHTFVELKNDTGIWIVVENNMPKLTLFRTDDTYENIKHFISQTYSKYCKVIIRIDSEDSMNKIEYYPKKQNYVQYPCSGDWFFN